jgi:hypothetical protein
MATKKQWWQSKTVWVNVVLFLIAVIGVFVDFQVFDQRILAIVAAVLNVVLRFITNTPIR